MGSHCLWCFFFCVCPTKLDHTCRCKKAIPLVGGVIGGGITFATFKPCCDKLKNVLQDTYLSNPNYKEKQEEYIDIESGKEVEISEEDIIIEDTDII